MFSEKQGSGVGAKRGHSESKNRLCSPIWYPLATPAIQIKTLNIENTGFSLAQVILQDEKQKTPHVATRPFF